MKKSVKTILILGVILFLAGLLISSIALIIGGKRVFQNITWNLADSRFIKNSDGHIWDNWDTEVYKGNKRDDKAALASEISNIDIDTNLAEVYIEESDDEYFKVETDGNISGEFSYAKKGDTFIVKGFRYKNKLLTNNKENPTIRIYIPKGKQFDSIVFNTNVSDVEISKMFAYNINIKTGLTDIKIRELKSDWLGVDISVGTIDIKDAAVTDADVNVGMGEFKYSGIVANNLKADCGMGSLHMELSDIQENHGYILECGMGSLKVGNINVSGMGSNQSYDTDKSSIYDIRCGMGDVNVTFTSPNKNDDRR